jgi:hypothetical protein
LRTNIALPSNDRSTSAHLELNTHLSLRRHSHFLNTTFSQSPKKLHYFLNLHLFPGASVKHIFTVSTEDFTERTSFHTSRTMGKRQNKQLRQQAVKHAGSYEEEQIKKVEASKAAKAAQGKHEISK